MTLKTLASVVAEPTINNVGIASEVEPQSGRAAVLLAWNLDNLFDGSSPHAGTDLVALNILLPHRQRAEVVQHIRARFPEVLLAVLPDSAEQRAITSVILDGAQRAPAHSNGYFSGNHTTATVDQPNMFFSAVEPRSDSETELDRVLAGLTQRQQQVIRLLTRGYSNKVIARELGISPSTVKVHVHAAFRALGVHSRMGAAAALREAQDDAFSSA